MSLEVETKKETMFKYGRRMVQLLKSGLLCTKIKLGKKNQKV